MVSLPATVGFGGPPRSDTGDEIREQSNPEQRRNHGVDGIRVVHRLEDHENGFNYQNNLEYEKTAASTSPRLSGRTSNDSSTGSSNAYSVAVIDGA